MCPYLGPANVTCSWFRNPFAKFGQEQTRSCGHWSISRLDDNTKPGTTVGWAPHTV